MYYKHFKINISSVLKTPESILQKSNKQRQRRLISNDINEEFLDFLKRKKLEIFLIDLFRLDRLQTYPIHIDNTRICDFPRVNFVYGNTQCPMIWYKLKKQNSEKELTSYFDKNIMLFDHKEVDEVDKTIIKNAAIVQTGHPHSVIHRGIGTRWTVSFIFQQDCQFLEFNTLCNLFSNYPD